MRRASVILLLGTLAISGVVAGCGGARTRDGRVAGVVEVCGDPMLGATAAEQRHCTLQAGSVSIFDATHRVAHMRLVDGRFALTLHPGRYTLIVWNSGNGPWKRAVTAVADQTKLVNVAIEAI